MSRAPMKTVPFKTPPKPVDPAQNWIDNRPSADVVEDRSSASVTPLHEPVIVAEPVEAMKRFTIDVSESLHKRIKSQCAMRGVKMADVIREMLEKEFPQG